ncbi:MAG: MFS transporter [Bacillota bacterium]
MREKTWLYMLCLAEIGTMLVLLNYSAVLPIIKEEWGLSNAQAGLIYSAYQVGYIILVMVLSTLTDYIDAKKIYVISAIWAGMAGIAFALFANGFVSALILRCLTGVGLAGTYMPGLKMVSAKFSSKRRGWAVGLYVGAFSLGTALSLFFSGILTGLFDWRTAIFVTSLGPIFGGILASITLDRVTPLRRAGEKVTFRHVLSNRPALLVMAGYAAHMWEMFGMRGWIVAFFAAAMVSRNMDMALAASYGAVFSAVIIMVGGFSTALAGAVSDRYGRVRTIQVIMFSSAACSLFFGWIQPWPAALVVLISLVYGFLVTAESSVLSTSVTELVSFEYLGSAMAVQSLFGWTAAAIAPVVFGVILDLTNPEQIVAELGYTPFWGPAFIILGLGALLGPPAVNLARKLSNFEYF